MNENEDWNVFLNLFQQWIRIVAHNKDDTKTITKVIASTAKVYKDLCFQYNNVSERVPKWELLSQECWQTTIKEKPELTKYMIVYV